MISTDPGVWITVMWFLIIYTFLIKYSPLFRFAEATSIGVAAGVMTSIGYSNIIRLSWKPLVEQGSIISIVPLIIGPLIFAQLFRRYRYLSRIPLGFMLATGLGVAMLPNIATSILVQVKILFLTPKSPFEIVNQLVLIFGVLGVVLLFSYTKEHTGIYGWVTKIGMWIMMLGFGASFGVGITSRATYLIDRLQALFFDLLGFGV